MCILPQYSEFWTRTQGLMRDINSSINLPRVLGGEFQSWHVGMEQPLLSPKIPVAFAKELNLRLLLKGS